MGRRQGLGQRWIGLGEERRPESLHRLQERIDPVAGLRRRAVEERRQAGVQPQGGLRLTLGVGRRVEQGRGELFDGGGVKRIAAR